MNTKSLNYLLIEPPEDNRSGDILSNKLHKENFTIEEYRNRHEYRGIKYLLGIGYEIQNIRLNNYSYIMRTRITTINDRQD